ncbi:MAG: efflux RND transporter periplasmic adaptor subunit [Leptolyngbya sp. SIOISBB]|nr:efflux RND transporter periplasmic adaptor subunit [Leptolyngbya sp. SIOISBB]
MLLTRFSHFLWGTALSLSVLSASCRPTPEANAAPPVVPVQIETLQSETIKQSSEFVGNLEAAQVVEVRPEIQGRIEQILVTPGQAVGAGQSVMVLKPDQTVPQYEGSLAAVDVAIGTRDNALKALDVAEAQLDSAEAKLDLDTVNVSRADQLVEAGALGQIRLDEALTQQEASQNDVIAAQEAVEAAKVQIQQAEATIRQAEAQADASLVSVEFKDVVTPIAGVMDDLPVKLGDYVSVGQPVAKVTQLDALLLNLQVPSNRSAELRTGLVVELLDPTSKQQLATGSLTFVSPTVDAEAQSILAKAQFRNPEGQLRDGQYVEARIIWETQPGVLVPVTAITRVGGKNFIYVLADETSDAGEATVARLTPVELGDIQGDDYQVISGVEVGDRIAVSNILKLSDGVPVEPASEAESESFIESES